MMCEDTLEALKDIELLAKEIFGNDCWEKDKEENKKRRLKHERNHR